MKFTLVTFLVVIGAAQLDCQECTVTVQVVPPSQTPEGSTLFIAGNSPKLGNWDPGRVALQRTADSLWSLSGQAPKGAVVEFKITRGSWNTQAVFEHGVIPDNIRFVVHNDTVITVRPVSWRDLELHPGGGITGSVRYHRGLMGKNLHYPRDVIVWLPPSYDQDSTRRFPVLYMHDGQNVFDPSTSFIGFDWRADEIADSLIKRHALEEMIIVGIYNTPDRSPEYSDTELGRAYARFVIDQLKPMIDSTYRTLPDARHTGVMGSSMGGLISFLFVWWHPDVFSKAGCLSSAFLGEGRLLQEVRNYRGPRKDIRVYLDCGTADLDERLLPGSKEMAEILRSVGYREGKDFELFIDQGAIHNERAWAGRLWRPLRFLFGI